MYQRVVALAGFHDDVASIASIAARRAAVRFKCLPAEGHAAIAAVACLDPNFSLINEHKNRSKYCHLHQSRCARQQKKPRPEGEALDCVARAPSPACKTYFASTGSTITYLPIWPRSLKRITPVILANNVSSLPRPTFKPGFTRVPRCRTMIVPPGTSCPPNALKPSRCALESRPFRDVP